ncbi:hypothetical protein E2542_SST30084 [Spatholobus suberectus]|nr:hypothetical protein E2542_SST30084 [Spatholobus suberectus]
MAHQQGGYPSSTKGIERRTGEALSRADQIDEATNYIKNLETMVKTAQERKESLMERKRSRSDSSSTSKAPKIILMCGFDNQYIFSEIVRILHEENIEVKSVHSSFAGNSMLHFVHAEINVSVITSLF